MAATQPRASILINNYNYGRFLSAAIDSCLAQTYPNVEIVVVDDGSTDDSRAIIAGYGDAVVAVLKQNGGQASAFNAGFAASSGELLFFLDSDDLFLPEKVARITAVFQSNPSAGYIFHRLKRVQDGTGAVVGMTPSQPTGPIDARQALRRGRLPLTLPATSGFCFRRSLLAEILPMPEAHNVYLSDKYLGNTAAALQPGFYLDEVLAELRIHGDNVYTSGRKRTAVMGRVSILTAYWMRRKLPDMAPYTNRLLAKGIGTQRRLGGVEPEFEPLVADYLSAVSRRERMAISAMAWAYAGLWQGYNRLWRRRANRATAEPPS